MSASAYAVRMTVMATTSTAAEHQGLLGRHVPIVDWLPRYQWGWLRSDAVAGLSVWALLVPQSLAYATLVGVPVQYGLYSAFAALLVYPLFGTSRHLAEGPSAAICAVSAAVITPLLGAGELGTAAAAPYAAALALAAAAVYFALGILRMGWVSTFLSKAVMGGFVLGFAIGIIIEQSAKLLGVPGTSGSYLQELWGTLKAIPDTHLATLGVGASCLAALLVMRHRFPRWPRALIVMAVAIPAAQVFDFAEQGIAVTGHVPTGLFTVGSPGIGWGDSRDLLLGGLAVVFVGFSESLAAARSMAVSHGYEIDPNQELIAQGACSAAVGLVGGFAVDGSLSKTSVADTAGQRTQMASLIDAVFVLLTMLFLASVFENLPSATLAAVVVDAMLGLVSFSQLRRYYRVNRVDWLFFVGAMAGILAFGIIAGILIGVVLSLLLLVARSSRTSVRLVGREPSSGTYHGVDNVPDLETTPGIVVARIDGPLFFADADRFRTRVKELGAAEDTLVAVVVDAEAVFLTDTDGADILAQVATELRGEGATLVLARVPHRTLELWRRAGVLNAVGDGVFDRIDDAVAAFAPNPSGPTQGTTPGNPGPAAAPLKEKS
jgi:high affinity sulfate transporter 1